MTYSLFDRYKEPDGAFVDGPYRGDTITSFLCGKLNFCGCSQPEAALLHVKGGLALLADLKSKVWEDLETFASWQARVKAHFGSIGAECFFWYWLNHNGWSEHGGAVPGWLTDSGELLLSLLEEWSKCPESESSD